MNKLEESDKKQLFLQDVIHWVAVEIEIPMAYMTVLVCFKGESLSSIRTAYWDGVSWIVNGSKPFLTGEITHWMQIAKPPCV